MKFRKLTKKQAALIEKYQYLPQHIWKKLSYLRQIKLNRDEYIQEGFVALTLAARYYNPLLAKFITYAYKAVKTRMLDYWSRDRLIAIPGGAWQKDSTRAAAELIMQARYTQLKDVAMSSNTNIDNKLDVECLLKKLGKRDKHILTRYFMEYQNMPTIADENKISREAVRHQLMRAIYYLRGDDCRRKERKVKLA